MSRSEPVNHPGWEGWYFEDGYLCSPNNDRFSSLVVMACFFWKQMSEVRSLWQAGSMRNDAPMVLQDKGSTLGGKWIPDLGQQTGSGRVVQDQPLAAGLDNLQLSAYVEK